MEDEQKSSTLCVYRNREWSGLLRGVRLILDGVEVGRLRPGRSLTVRVAPGPHRLQARQDWAFSEELSLCVSEEERVPIRLAYPFSALKETLLRPKSAIHLHRS